jgi:hypothetical protein
MKKAFAFLFLASVILLTFCIRGYFKISRAGESLNNYSAWVSHFDTRFQGLEIPNEMNFAGEVVPLHDLEIRGRYAGEMLSNSYWLLPSIFKDQIRSKIYRDIKAILKQEGIPEDFIYLALAESQLLNKVSPKGAAGIWQIMPSSAPGLGLEINEFLDERYDYIKATYAACRYLKQAYEELGSWTLAAASYNMGIGGISRKVSLSGTDDYYSLRLNNETTAYLYRILAIKQIMTSKNVRFAPETIQYAIHNVDSSINDIEEFCISAGCDFYTLKQFNPWLIGHKLPNQGKKYKIMVPLNYTPIAKNENFETVTDTPVHVRIQNRLLSLFR